MTDSERVQRKETPEGVERYTPGYGAELVRYFQSRTVSREAAFFAPHLRSGMTLLDCGCGPGTITVGLAEVVSPGQVVGIDMEASQVEGAQAHALQRGVSNVRFQAASVYELPFPDASFDAVFAHALLQHLGNPAKALTEMHRVLKPGGVVGVRDDDRGGLIIAPHSPQVERLIELILRVMEHHGGDPRMGRRHRELLRQAGFARTEASASCEYDGTLEATRRRGELGAHAAESYVAETAVPLGWTTPDELKELIVADRSWGDHPDAFDAVIWCEAVGWKE